MENIQDNTLDLKQIVSKCLDSEGYIIFAARLTPEKDAAGDQIIEEQYRRYHFSLEDAKKSTKIFKEYVKKEIDELIERAREDQQGFAD